MLGRDKILLSIVAVSALIVAGAAVLGVQTGSTMNTASNPISMDNCNVDSTGGECTGPSTVYMNYDYYVTPPITFWVSTSNADVSSVSASDVSCEYSLSDLGPGRNDDPFFVKTSDGNIVGYPDDKPFSDAIDPVTVSSLDQKVEDGEVLCKFSFGEIWENGKDTNGQLQYIEGYPTLGMENPELTVNVAGGDPSAPAPPPPPAELFINFLQGILDGILDLFS